MVFAEILNIVKEMSLRNHDKQLFDSYGKNCLMQPMCRLQRQKKPREI